MSESTVDATARLAGRRRARRSVPICLRADLRAQMQDLQRELEAAEQQRTVAASLDAGGRSRELAERLVALHEQMLTHTITVVVEAAPRRVWTQLIAEHPPADGDERSKALGVDEEGFFGAAIRTCAVEPQLSDQDWTDLIDGLSAGEWEALTSAVWGVNARDVDVPFSRLALRVLGLCEPGSAQPEPSA